MTFDNTIQDLDEKYPSNIVSKYLFVAFCEISTQNTLKKGKITASESRDLTSFNPGIRDWKSSPESRDSGSGFPGMDTLITGHYKILQDTTRHCKTLQSIARHYNILQGKAKFCKKLQDIAKYSKILQDLTRHCKALQDITTYCKIKQDFARHCKT